MVSSSLVSCADSSWARKDEKPRERFFALREPERCFASRRNREAGSRDFASDGERNTRDRTTRNRESGFSLCGSRSDVSPAGGTARHHCEGHGNRKPESRIYGTRQGRNHLASDFALLQVVELESKKYSCGVIELSELRRFLMGRIRFKELYAQVFCIRR